MTTYISGVRRFDYLCAGSDSFPVQNDHREQLVTIVRPLTEQEADGPNQGEPQMYLVRGATGQEFEAFESELVA